MFTIKTPIGEPTIADGRDILYHLMNENETDWRPSMNLQELIQRIPAFIGSVIKKKGKHDKEEAKGGMKSL